jgi:hypothetical protein
MRKNKSTKIFRKLHKWPGIIIALFAILFALSGIIMNHRQLFSTVDISRNLLPHNYRYQNWNLAAVRGSLPVEKDSVLIYGNIGIWKAPATLDQLPILTRDFPRESTTGKYIPLSAIKNVLYAGTHFGLYKREHFCRGMAKNRAPGKAGTYCRHGV